MTWLYVLLVLQFVLLLGAAFFIVALLNAGMRNLKRLESYEKFYDESIEVVSGFADFIGNLIQNRQMLYDDPDVQQIYKSIVYIRDFLLGYINAKEEEGK